MTPLERRYRLLLHAYPRSYREHRGEEMLDTLLAGAAPGQTRPSWRDAADLIGGGARERAGAHAVPGFANGLRLAGPIALALVAGVTGSAWLVGERTIAASAVAAAWAVAVLARALLPRTGALPALGALAVTLGAVGVAGGQFIGPAVTGLVAAVGTAQPARLLERVTVPTGAALLIAFPVLATLASAPDAAANIVQSRTQDIVTLGMLALAVAGVVTLVRRRDARPWWALLILLTCVPTLARIMIPLGGAESSWRLGPGLALYGRVPAISLFAVALLVACVHLAGRSRDPLAGVGELSLIVAAGLSLFAFVAEVAVTGRTVSLVAAPAYALFVAAALTGPTRRWIRRVLIGAAVFVVAGISLLVVSGQYLIAPGRELAGALALLGLIALTSPASHPPARPGAIGILRRAGQVAAVGVGTFAVAAVVFGFPQFAVLDDAGNEAVWQEVFVAPAVAAIPLVATLIVTAAAVLRRDRRWAAPLPAYAVGLLGCVLTFGVAQDSAASAAIVVGGVGLLVALRLVIRMRVVSRIAT
jgi:hypothetical protein